MKSKSVLLILNFEYLGENETKNETILTHWSVGQAGSNDEINWGSKISLDCPFKLRRLSPPALAAVISGFGYDALAVCSKPVGIPTTLR